MRFVLLCSLAPLLGCTILTQPVRPSSRVGPIVRADTARLEATVRRIARPRDFKDAAALAAVVEHLEEELTALGYEPIEQSYEVHIVCSTPECRERMGGERFDSIFKNVRVLIGDPTRPRVVVGAHYDSRGPLPAADDNASGVAVVLELARLLKAHPSPGTVELAFWPLEEPPFFRSGFMGSRVHADELRSQGAPVTAALSIETVGYYSDEPGSQHYSVPLVGKLYPHTGNFLALVANLDNTSLVRRVKSAMLGARRIPVHSFNAPARLPGIDWSDHLNFWKNGYPALMVTDTAPNRNPNYHEPTDTPDTLSYPRMARVTEVLFEAVWALSR